MTNAGALKCSPAFEPMRRILMKARSALQQAARSFAVGSADWIAKHLIDPNVACRRQRALRLCERMLIPLLSSLMTGDTSEAPLWG